MRRRAEKKLALSLGMEAMALVIHHDLTKALHRAEAFQDDLTTRRVVGPLIGVAVAESLGGWYRVAHAQQ